MATRVTFVWEEDGAMSYDALMDHLMSLGAEDIETTDFERPRSDYQTGLPKDKKPSSGHPGEGIADPGGR